ncbi:MAG: hypothetical protein CMB80_05725 [Flammeovirgaceae bacterium]|nr:hypothetical protein [Flammeovirgaceae bacterium]
MQINENTSNKGLPNNKTRKKTLDLKVRKVKIINQMVIEYSGGNATKKAELLWGDKSGRFVRDLGLINEFSVFLNMCADLVAGVRPENITTHGRQLIRLRNAELKNNPHLSRVINNMEKAEIYSEMILLFEESLHRFDPKRRHKSKTKNIHFVGYLQYNYKFSVQKWLKNLSKRYQDSLDLENQAKNIPVADFRASKPEKTSNDTGLILLGLDAIEKYVDKLNLIEKQVISLRYVKNMKCKEVAQRMNITQAQVTTITKDATEKIRKAYSES